MSLGPRVFRGVVEAAAEEDGRDVIAICAVPLVSASIGVGSAFIVCRGCFSPVRTCAQGTRPNRRGNEYEVFTTSSPNVMSTVALDTLVLDSGGIFQYHCGARASPVYLGFDPPPQRKQ